MNFLDKLSSALRLDSFPICFGIHCFCAVCLGFITGVKPINSDTPAYWVFVVALTLLWSIPVMHYFRMIFDKDLPSNIETQAKEDLKREQLFEEEKLKRLQHEKLQSRLESAVSNNDIGRVRQFIAQGADAKTSYALFENYSWKQQNKGYQEMVDVFLEYGFDINSFSRYQNETLLHKATEAGDIELVKYLLQKGADPHIQNHKLFTALELAEDADYGKNSYQEMVDLLRSHTEKKTIEEVLEVKPTEEAPKRKTMKI